MSSIEVLDQLIAAAGLPAVVSTEPVGEHGDGLDNLLTKATLANGRQVLLRESRVQRRRPHAAGCISRGLWGRRALPARGETW